MNVDVYILCRNEEEILPYVLRHYLTFARHIFIYEGRSTDNSRKIIQNFQDIHNLGGDDIRGWPKFDRINLIDWEKGQQLDDAENSHLKSVCWLGTTADWVICVDCDELIYFPTGTERELTQLWQQGTPVVAPKGWEMMSEVFPTTPGQIYDEIKYASPDDRWYGKPVLFRPSLVKAVQFAPGAHGGAFVLSNGVRKSVDFRTPRTSPDTWLLHCKHLGPVERVARRYDQIRQAYSANNVSHHWGNYEAGIKHATDKRRKLSENVQRIFP